MKKIFVYLFLITTFITQAYSQIDWIKDPNNPVLKRGENKTWDNVTVGSPSVIYEGTRYHMWYNGFNGSNTNFGYATSTDKINWVKHPIPVLSHGGPGSWDGSFILHPTVYFDGTTYHMWYTGGGGEFGKIGYATSPDSITWTKYSDHPVLTPGDPGSWDDQGINSPEVLFIDGVFHMWFGGFDGSQAQIGHATSLNGIDWEKDTLPVLQVGMAGSWDNASVSQPSVLFDGKMFHMWYGGGTDFNWKIGYAKSIDGKTWQRDDKNNPVLEPGLSVQWVGYQTVCFNSDSTFFDMWYTAGVSAGFVSDIGYATAPFVPVPQNPIQNSGFESWIGDTPEGWETSNQVGIQNVLPSTDAHSGNFSARMEIVEWQGIPFAPQLFTDDGGFGFQISERYNMLTGYYKLIPQEGDFLDVSVIMLSDGQWLIGSGTATYSEAADTWTQFSIPINYLGTENPVYCSIQVNVGFSQNVGGIAFIDDLELSVISDIESSTADEIPDNFELSQNYPNPFNPSTTLKYSVPKFSNVVIKVFDILGNEIQTLVNKEKATGTYELTWYAEGFPSGVYFYRLQAGDFVETKKMILMK